MDNRIVLAISIVLGTAVLLAAYDHTMEGSDDGGKTARRTFAKTVVVGGVVAAAVLYFTDTTPRISRAPFPSTDALPQAAMPPPASGGGGGTVPLPTQ